MIVEYEFILKEDGRTKVPSFIVDGGYFKVGSKYVGVAASDGTPIPETLVVMDRASLITRLTNMGCRVGDPDAKNIERRRLATAEEIETIVDTFISEHDI